MREQGPTYAVADIGFIDFESKSPIPIGDGTYRYMREATPLIFACAIGTEPAQAIPFHVNWADLPREIRQHHQRVLKGEAVWAAWNAAFDREVWNQLTDFPELDPEHCIDVMAQAMAAGLPGALDGAARFSGCHRKPANAKALIKLFAIDQADPADHPEEWQRFLDYAANDVEVMREVFQCTLQLPKEDWEEYWTSERINLRGIGVDLELAHKASAMAAADRLLSGGELSKLTDGKITAVTQVKRMIPWLDGVLAADARSIMVRRLEEIDEETGEVTKEGKQSLNRARIQLLLALLTHKADHQGLDDGEQKALRLLTIRQFGGSTTPAKFGRMLDTNVDGELLGQYVFNGAPQTGRFCVAADTLIETPDGTRKIVDLQRGSVVYGGSGEPQLVQDRICKGRETMYRLDGPNGEHVVATAAHRVLTCNGWQRIDECFQETAAGHFVLRRGCAPVSYCGSLNRVDWQDAWSYAAYGIGRGQAQHVNERVRSTEVGELLAQQDRREQSDAGRTLRRRAHPASRPGSRMERQGIHAGSTHYRRPVARTERVAEALERPPYRWEQDQRQSGQSGAGHATRAPEAAQTDTWSLVCVGEGEVWDISVAGDESYLAQGMIHHNSSRVTQIHNLMRDALPYEMDAIDALLAGASPDEFARLGDTTPISRKLSMLIRPALVPADGDAFVWGDWSQIEARVLPWLAGESGNERLDIFRAVDADPSVPDIYVRTASVLSDLPIAQIDKPLRQRGKVVELACGFGGARNALQAMAAGYGMHLDDDLARRFVADWRAANPWATDFWAALWQAVNDAMQSPGHFFEAGHVAYIFLKEYLGGTLLCRLPSGRMLQYRKIKWEQIEDVDDDGKVLDVKWELTFARGYGRVKLWPGILAENITQATAACCLRGTLVKLRPWPVRAHTHDEILVEVAEHAAEQTADRLVTVMEQGFEWSEGLPLKAEATIALSYTKCEAAQGL